MEALGQRHLAILEAGADPVPHLIAGRDAAPGHFQGFVQDHAQLVPVHLLVGTSLQERVEVQPFEEVEADVAVVVEILQENLRQGRNASDGLSGWVERMAWRVV
jgi:hypothetical protein